VRFLGRKIYWGVVVVLMTAMQHGAKPTRVEILRERLGIDRRTLERWRTWWLVTFVESRFWKEARAHHGSRRVLLPSGQWSVPLLLGILDDHSRLCCHAQWYLAEGTEELCHGLSQAFQKRAIPRSLLEDNGSATRPNLPHPFCGCSSMR
jgi:hypothetical protein